MKKALSIVLSLVMIMTMLPTFAITALAEDAIIDRLEINYTTNNAIPSCADGDLLSELRGCLDGKSYSDGTNPNVAYGQNVYLFSYTGPNQTGTRTQVSVSSTAELDPALYYYLNIQASAKNRSFDFKHDGTTFDTGSVTFVVNGVEMTDIATSSYNEYWKLINIYIPIELDLTNKVYSVAITNTEKNVEKDSSLQINSNVKYYGVGYDSVAWSVEGASSTGTAISSTGLLTVGADETASAITVKATSTADSSVYATKSLKVLDKVSIDSVSLNITAADVFPDTTKSFTATVVGTDAHDVVWTLVGNESASTTITPSDKNCTLSIAKDETASTLTVTVTSVKDSSKFATATITVLPITDIHRLVIDYTTDKAVVGTPDVELLDELRGCLDGTYFSDGKNPQVARGFNIYLFAYTGPNRTGERTQVLNGSTNNLDANLYYYLDIEADARTGFDFKHTGSVFDTESVTYVVNGVEMTDLANSTYNEYWKIISIYIPISLTCIHSYESTVTKQPTCSEFGEKTYTCSLCGDTYVIDKDNFADYDQSQWTGVFPLGHTGYSDLSETTIIKQPTCSELGECTWKCKRCGIDQYDLIVKNLNNHNYKTATTGATTSADGKVVTKCTACGKIQSTTVIDKIGKVTLGTTKYTYDGKAKKPAVTVKDSKGNKIAASNYTVKYSNNTKAGKATVKITFKGNYSGTVTKTFSIVPKGTTISTLTAASKGFTAKWKKQATQTTGYQIQIATDSKFTKGVKNYTVTKNSTVSKKITKLTGKKKYYVRIRTYKTVSGTKYYSSWSAKKYVTTKK